MKKVKILLVEDEAIVAQDVAMRLQQKGYSISGVASNAKEALGILASSETDLCLLDIALGNRVDGIALAHLINESYQLPIIYLTAQKDEPTFERAVETKPAAFILKPFTDRELEIAIDLAISNFASGKTARQWSSQSSVKEDDMFSLKESIFLRKKEKFERVALKDILWAEAESNYTTIVTADSQFVLSVTLHDVESHLPAPSFMRIHRSYVVNMQHVESIEGNMLYIKKRPFQVSKTRREEIFRCFKMI
jgi:DNA-binding LytR/AlgR family response regulator